MRSSGQVGQIGDVLFATDLTWAWLSAVINSRKKLTARDIDGRKGLSDTRCPFPTSSHSDGPGECWCLTSGMNIGRDHIAAVPHRHPGAW